MPKNQKHKNTELHGPKQIKKTVWNISELEEMMTNAFASIIAKNLEGGKQAKKFIGRFTLNEIEESFCDALAGFRNMMEKSESETLADEIDEILTVLDNSTTEQRIQKIRKILQA